MAYISSKCVECTEKTKRCAGEYSAKDEAGKKFQGRMYLCDKTNCDINRVRQRAERDFQRNEDRQLRESNINPHTDFSRRKRTYKGKEQ